MLLNKIIQFVQRRFVYFGICLHPYDLNRFDIRPVPLMDLMIKLHKERQNLRIGLQHVGSLQFAYSVAVDDRYLVLQE